MAVALWNPSRAAKRSTPGWEPVQRNFQALWTNDILFVGRHICDKQQDNWANNTGKASTLNPLLLRLESGNYCDTKSATHGCQAKRLGFDILKTVLFHAWQTSNICHVQVGANRVSVFPVNNTNHRRKTLGTCDPQCKWWHFWRLRTLEILAMFLYWIADLLSNQKGHLMLKL